MVTVQPMMGAKPIYFLINGEIMPDSAVESAAAVPAAANPLWKAPVSLLTRRSQ